MAKIEFNSYFETCLPLDTHEMYNYFIFWTGILCLFNPVHAQQIYGTSGAESAMLGGVSVVLSNAYAVVNNPAQLTSLKNWQAGLYNENRFNQKELQYSNFSINVPIKYFSAGFGINYYGFDQFNQQRYMLALASKISQQFSAGIQLNYAVTQMGEYGAAGTWLIGLGLKLQITTKLQSSFFVFNPNQANQKRLNSINIPTYARLGFKHQVNKKVNANVEFEQAIEQPFILRFGIGYDLSQSFGLGTGFAVNPVIYSFGFYYKSLRTQVHLASQIHQILGFTPMASLLVPVNKELK
ncbi:MAG: hypothetical protein MUC81_04015 [Bacteroidia bacterium]|nr:hypothetical protein [Bacteroidia bacterium]